MTKRNLCDTCLHRAVCRHGIAQQWGRMAALRLLRASDPDGAHAWAAALVGQDGDTTRGG